MSESRFTIKVDYQLRLPEERLFDGKPATGEKRSVTVPFSEELYSYWDPDDDYDIAYDVAREELLKLHPEDDGYRTFDIHRYKVNHQI